MSAGTAPPRVRNEAIDLLRGCVMIVMALDHARDFFGQGIDPTDLSATTPVLFFTRFITHYCASVFVFLAGTAAALSTVRKTTAELSRFLLVRGLWLVLLELTVVRFCWLFDPGFHLAVLQVIWAIGCSMVVLSALVWLPRAAIATFGVVLVVGHNLLDGVHASGLGALRIPWTLLHEPGPVATVFGGRIVGIYPLIPWMGVMACGFAFASLLRDERRRSRTVQLGLALTLAFVVLRLTNLYGDPNPWHPQRSPMFTLLAFLDCEKYPPSLLYLLMTLGPALCLLGALDDGKPLGRIRRVLVVFGRVPLFYYVLHVFFIHLVAVALDARHEGLKAFSRMYLRDPVGLSLPMVYLLWVLIVTALYPLCAWFSDLKRRRNDRFLSYL